MQVGDIFGNDSGGSGWKVVRIGSGKESNWPGYPSSMTDGTILQSVLWDGLMVYVVPSPFNDLWQIDDFSGRSIGYYNRQFRLKQI